MHASYRSEDVFTKKKNLSTIYYRGIIMPFYIGLGMQLVGFSSVGLCLFAGMSKGDYGKLELIELIGGSLIFYLGTFIKNKSNNE